MINDQRSCIVATKSNIDGDRKHEIDDIWYHRHLVMAEHTLQRPMAEAIETYACCVLISSHNDRIYLYT